MLVYFWAHWCPLCRVGGPALNELAKRPDFAVVGVSLDYGADEGAVRDGIASHGLRFQKQIAGGSRRDPNSPHRQVGPVDFFPTSYLYDPTGEIVMFIPGQVKVNKVLAFAEAWKAKQPVVAAPALPPAIDFKRFDAALMARAGKSGKAQAAALAPAWRELLTRLNDAGIDDKLAGVNEFINHRIRLNTSPRADYWAAPAEALATGRGGVEEIAIAKYFALVALHVPAENLRLVYARQRDGAGATKPTMILAYYPAARQDPLLLDSLRRAPSPARERDDLRPVFSFNSQALWGDASGLGGASGDLPVWQDCMRRAREQGFE